MNVTIPFSKEIVFKSNIAEITSISLEHDVSINESDILGDFIVSGDYKNHDINVDTMPFSHVIPFSVSLDNDIDLNTLKYNICDFTYDVINKDTLKVDILFNVEASKIENKIDELFVKPEDEEVISDDRKEELVVDTTTLNDQVSDVSRTNDQSSDILTNQNFENDFITYHIHLVKLNETVESICSTYKISKTDLLELNNIDNISLGDKILIPLINE